MSLALAATLAASAAALPTCSWDRPGHNAFVGDVVAAVDRYQDIPAPVRAALKKRMAERRYDEIVVIKRDAILGRSSYAPEILEMHFGTGQVCGNVTRETWTAAAEELGLVYCESGHCIMVPTVCRNVSRITRLAGPTTVAEAPPPSPPTAPPAPPAPPPELPFEPPGAGVTAPPTITPITPPPELPPPTFPPPQPPFVTPTCESCVLPPPLPPIPEPASALLMAAGLAGLLAWRRRQRAQVSPD